MNFLILGMPNVGKTSIYNLITESNYNIIHKTVGTTRDWHYAPLKNNNNINIYDSPGIILDAQNKLNNDIKNLINTIDIFLFVIDYKNKNFHNEKELINICRKFNKEIILIVNKDDNYNQDKDLKFLGIKKIFYISCTHKIGLIQFLQYF